VTGCFCWLVVLPLWVAPVTLWSDDSDCVSVTFIFPVSTRVDSRVSQRAQVEPVLDPCRVAWRGEAELEGFVCLLLGEREGLGCVLAIVWKAGEGSLSDVAVPVPTDRVAVTVFGRVLEWRVDRVRGVEAALLVVVPGRVARVCVGLHRSM